MVNSKQTILTLLCISTLVLAGSKSAVGQAKSQPTDQDADRATLVIMAPSGPVFADLRISVAKVPYRMWVGKFLATQMDIDKNRSLDAKELGLLTDNIRRLAAISGADEILRSMGGDQPVQAVSTKDFAEWLRQRLPKAFDLIAQPQSSDDAVRLSSLIDSNGSASITDDELLAAFQTLRFRDLDNDETFSVSELLPYRDPRSQLAAVSPDAVSLPFFHVTDDDSTNLAAERILKRYGNEEKIAASLLRQSSEVSDEKMLDADAIRTLLADPVFHLTLNVRLSDKANTSDVDVAIAPTAAGFCEIKDDSFGQTSLVIDGLPMKIVARGGGANNRVVTRGFLGQTFVMIDSDKNQYLDETEFAGIVSALQQSGANGDFAVVDQNGDKMVTRDELFSFAERDQIASASRIEVTVKQDGKTLFGLLDANQDRRLSAREVRSGTHVLTQYDRNSDGVFAETELGTEYVLTLGLGRSELRRSAGTMMGMNRMQMGAGDAILPGNEGLSGPEWFRRMDRNQDGDVSRREFPGSIEHFQRLDTDHDLLISATEAESVQ